MNVFFGCLLFCFACSLVKTACGMRSPEDIERVPTARLPLVRCADWAQLIVTVAWTAKCLVLLVRWIFA
jgi:hypothetical protein